MITSGCVYKFYDLRRWYCQHIIFKINTYDDHDALDDECRCAAYLFHYVNEKDHVVVKNLLINWLPDAAEEKVCEARTWHTIDS
jgi:hypothetical protein